MPACRAAVVTRGPASAVPLTWWTPESTDDRGAHLEWCGAVGPAVIVTPASGSVSMPRIDDIVIVSWNTHVGGGDIRALVRDLRSGRWTEGQGTEHFILLLQEVFRQGPEVPSAPSGPAGSAIRPAQGSSPRMDVVWTAETLGLHLFYAPSMRNGASDPGMAPEDRGNAILSTMPLRDVRVIELPFERQRRVAVAARVEVAAPSGSAMALLLVSAHLDTRGTTRRGYVLGPPARTRQMRGLLDALPGDAAAVMGGDLNTWFGDAEGAYGAARRSFPQTPAGGGATSGRMRLDYLFFRLPMDLHARWRVLPDEFGSDHQPVLGVIRPRAETRRPERTGSKP